MTTLHEPNADPITVATPPALLSPSPDTVAARREALTALDSFVRPLIAEKLTLPLTFQRPAVELTIYDQPLRRTRAGGHWTASSRWMGLLSHTIAGYTIELHFDEDDRPSHFVLSGAQTVVTPDATPEALACGLDAVAHDGPLITWAPNFPPGLSL